MGLGNFSVRLQISTKTYFRERGKEPVLCISCSWLNSVHYFFSLLFCVLIILALPERETALILTYFCDTGVKGFNTIMI